jgi:hypothetical protein
MIVLIMRAYRKYVFTYFIDLVRPAHQDLARQGRIMLNQVSFRQYFVGDWEEGISIVNPKQTKLKTIREVLGFLWGFDAESKRGPWRDAPFRVLAQRACNLIEAHSGITGWQKFYNLLGRYFIATH